MRTTALVLVAALALGAAPVRAEAVAPKPRGLLSGVGLGLLIGGLAGFGVGAAGVMGANDATAQLVPYGGVFTVEEQPSGDALQRRFASGIIMGVVGFVGGTLALAAGITCLLLDAPRASVAFVPTAQGGVFVFSGRF